MSSAPWWAEDADGASPGSHVEVLRPHVELHVPQAEPEAGTTRGVVVGAGVLTTAVLLTGILGAVAARDQMAQLQAAGLPARTSPPVAPADLPAVEPTAEIAGGRAATPAPVDVPTAATRQATVVVAPPRPAPTRQAPSHRDSDHPARRPATSGGKTPRPRPSAPAEPPAETDVPPVMALSGPASPRPRATTRRTTAKRPRSAPAKDGVRRRTGATRPATSTRSGATRP
ncbi:hypothetical protein [Arsenicicoccus dermatophilus]|uniref:hypothetical protein n=1 Tax=Arsenicicoccus dermatophilus TaxID=1076331 RepID=UPI001F4CA3DA|nr:hypothetical protein [Arsenicicoccus dermatophilus]MCH8613269.1 hypothetical protein [Arsenicicoccus dermatophilus]